MSTNDTKLNYSENQLLHCSFCGKNVKEVATLIAGPNNIYICEQCVAISQEIIIKEKESAKTEP